MEIGEKYKENLEAIADEIVLDAKLSGKSIFEYLDELYHNRVVNMYNKRCYKCVDRIFDVGVFLVRHKESCLESGKHFVSKEICFFHLDCLHDLVFQAVLSDGLEKNKK